MPYFIDYREQEQHVYLPTIMTENELLCECSVYVIVIPDTVIRLLPVKTTNLKQQI